MSAKKSMRIINLRLKRIEEPEAAVTDTHKELPTRIRNAIKTGDASKQIQAPIVST
jgi:hypothetical protein